MKDGNLIKKLTLLDYASTTGPETSLDDEGAKEFTQVFFDDSWCWDIDWGSIMPTGVMD